MKQGLKRIVNPLLITSVATICLPLFWGCADYEVDGIPVVVIQDTCSTSHRLAALEEEYARLAQYQIHTDTLVERSYNATNTILVVLSVIIAIAAIYLTWYINKAEKKLLKIKNIITTKQNDVIQVSKDTSALLNQIKNDTDDLFERIRRKDTESLLTRLVDVPQDIVNVERVLLARDLIEKDFKLVKEAYSKLCGDKLDGEVSGIGGQTYKQLYMVLFFRHFFGKALEDNSLRDSVLDSLVSILDGAFVIDVEKANTELAAFVSNKSVEADRGDVLYVYISSLKMSKYKRKESLFTSLKELVTDRELWDLIQKKIHDEE